MNTSERHLTQRLDELFSSPIESPEKQPEVPAVTPEVSSARAAGPIGPAMVATADLSSHTLERENEKQLVAQKSFPTQIASAPQQRPAAPLIYEKDRVGYVYHHDEVEPLQSLKTEIKVKEEDSFSVPLMVGGEGIGELRVASPDQHTWTPEEISLTHAVAQQVSLQVENLRLLTAAERARAEAENATRRFTHEGWDSYLDAIHQKERLGYVYDQASVSTYTEKLPINDGFRLPLTVTGEEVGALYLKPDPAQPLTEEDKALIDSTARQLAQQIENLRLLADAARARAEAEESLRLLTRNSWQTYAEGQGDVPLSFAYDTIQVVPVDPSVLPQQRALSEPLKVRGETIGQLAVASDKEVSPEDASLTAAIAAQLSVHIETLRLTEELHKRAAELEKLDKLKNAFLANMSHELRTPLNSILGFSDVMLEGLDGPLTETMESDLKLINRNGQHLLSLINDVLDMAKIEAGKMNLNFERFNLHEVLVDVVNITASLARDKALALNLETDASTVLEIEADRIRLRQVMINLVGNAIKFTESGSVTISAARQDERIRINVHDTGIGVPPGQAQMIFEEFSQVDTSTTRKTGGTGLGLPISRKLIELHSGQLWVESTGVPGEGSTFIIELPVTREAKHD
jgi:signal transduction histidine kinase